MKPQISQKVIQFALGLSFNLLLAGALFFLGPIPFWEISRDGTSIGLGIGIIVLVVLETIALGIKLPKVYARKERSIPVWFFFVYTGHLILTMLLLGGGIQMITGSMPSIFLFFGMIAKELALASWAHYQGQKSTKAYTLWEGLSDAVLIPVGVFFYVTVWLDVLSDPFNQVSLYGVDAIVRYCIVFVLVYYPLRMAYSFGSHLVTNTWKERIYLALSIGAVFWAGLLKVL